MSPKHTATWVTAMLAALVLSSCSLVPTASSEARSPVQESSSASPTPTASPSQTPTQTPTPTPTPTPSPTEVPAVLEPGATGDQVRELQARLIQLDWLEPPTTGRYDAATRTGVHDFQAKRG